MRNQNPLEVGASFVALAILANCALAQEWPQWRGPNRDGVVASFTSPKVWPDKLKTVWKVQAGIGHSSPVVVGRRVYLHSRQEESEVASCFDLDTGKLIWHDSYTTPYTMNPAALDAYLAGAQGALIRRGVPPNAEQTRPSAVAPRMPARAPCAA